MKYLIESIRVSQHDKLLECYPCLNDFGYTVEEEERHLNVPIRDENGARIVQVVRDTVFIPYIFLDNLDDLDRLSRACDCPLIYCNETTDYRGRASIEIYDDYRE